MWSVPGGEFYPLQRAVVAFGPRRWRGSDIWRVAFELVGRYVDGQSSTFQPIMAAPPVPGLSVNQMPVGIRFQFRKEVTESE